MPSQNPVRRLVSHLSDTWLTTSKDLSGIGPAPLALLHGALSSLAESTETAPKDDTLVYATLLSLANDKINSFPYSQVPEVWRRLYTEAGLLWAAHDLVRDEGDDSFWEGVVARLNMVLVVAGAPGPGRRELVNDLIDAVQETHLPSPPWNTSIPEETGRAVSPGSFSSASEDDEDTESAPRPKKPRLDSTAPSFVASSSSHSVLLAPNPIPSLPHPPSLTSFVKHHLDKPFILRGYLRQTGWPALDPTSPWSDRDYLLHVAGRGRIVPVEIGGEYTEEGWGQGMVRFEEFLERIGFGSSEAKEGDVADERPPLYLAQHSLLTQLPKLRRDVLLPDYVYSEPPEVEGGYHAPTTEDGVLVNVWVGGEGRSSPSHTDPYYNCYAQVVGSKRIFLTPPHHSSSMYPFSSTPSPPSPSASSSSPPPTSAATSLMGNTSRVPIFNPTNTPPSREQFPDFYAEALPESMEAVLDAGDLLVMGPGWWHAMRQEGGAGWGVSFWF